MCVCVCVSPTDKQPHTNTLVVRVLCFYFSFCATTPRANCAHVRTPRTQSRLKTQKNAGQCLCSSCGMMMVIVPSRMRAICTRVPEHFALAPHIGCFFLYALRTVSVSVSNKLVSVCVIFNCAHGGAALHTHIVVA